ncbi:hydroxypyruvate isomerase family protein [Streptomyces subrutilus]|uniref:Hydroxypyruvate isomerase n=1 Tax=Streptomyces subrutilus TaxID=36818 RepID=A0A5P2UWG1_9ACTN|nr:TIM barrel protein [Streptomyces subrutilus]QEU82575.1 hydroxypyruvate isomerase [Streptomyces subrutilus]WSJ27945.1 TIM barrel protein [Streptomyces subrutilus]GGZ82239.1 hydroxypyruvate isomerase [Streptomyces subrutilus]
MHAPNGLRFDANLKWLFTEVPFEERFDAASAAGFTAVEYADPYPYPAARLRRRLTDAGLHQVLINAPVGEPGSPERAGAACLPGRTDRFRSDLQRGLDYAVELGCDVLHVLGGIRPDGISHDRAFATFVTNLAWAVDQARDTGICLVLEAQNSRDAPGYLLDTQARAAAVVEALGGNGIGLLLDLYHVQVQEGDLISALREQLPRIRHVQIADPPDRTEPGSGEIAWPRVFDTLLDASYQGWIGCEYRPADGTVNGLSWLAEQAAAPATAAEAAR